MTSATRSTDHSIADALMPQLTKQAIAHLERRQAEYDAEVKDWYENGDGRPSSEGGRGYRFPHCIHGTSLWTDYDNICFGCEEPLTLEEQAEPMARERAMRIEGLMLFTSGTGIPNDLVYTDEAAALLKVARERVLDLLGRDGTWFV